MKNVLLIENEGRILFREVHVLAMVHSGECEAHSKTSAGIPTEAGLNTAGRYVTRPQIDPLNQSCILELNEKEAVQQHTVQVLHLQS